VATDTVAVHNLSAQRRMISQFPPKSIRYSAADVTLMVRVAAAGSIDSFARRTATTPARVRQIASGKSSPTPGILAHFSLTPEDGAFVWHVR